MSDTVVIDTVTNAPIEIDCHGFDGNCCYCGSSDEIVFTKPASDHGMDPSDFDCPHLVCASCDEQARQYHDAFCTDPEPHLLCSSCA
jgi:hypothetical protein